MRESFRNANAFALNAVESYRTTRLRLEGNRYALNTLRPEQQLVSDKPVCCWRGSRTGLTGDRRDGGCCRGGWPPEADALRACH